MICQQCGEDHSPDCFYSFKNLCVFCVNKVNEWKVKGEVITRNEDSKFIKEKKEISKNKRKKFRR